MVNTALLQAQIAKYPINQKTGAEFHRQLFTLYPECAKYFDAEDIDPDSLHKSRKFQQIGGGITRAIFMLASDWEEQTNWKGTVTNLIQTHKEYGVPFEDFKKALPAVQNMMEVVTGQCTDEQKKEWENLFNECFKTMQEIGW